MSGATNRDDWPSSRRAGRRGSSFSDGQIAFAVKDGNAVKVRTVEGDTLVGWVFGSDDYHWGLVTPDVRIVLVHKSAPVLEVTDMLLSEQNWTPAGRDAIDQLVDPFRAYVMRTHFNSKAVPSTT